MTEKHMNALPPVPEIITIGDQALEITPLKVGELPAFARAVRPIAAQITSEPDWLRLLSEDGESVIAALAIASRKPVEWISGLALDEAIRVAEAVFCANADFFLNRVMPEITRASQQLQARIPGAMPSPASSGPGIAIPTS